MGEVGAEIEVLLLGSRFLLLENLPFFSGAPAGLLEGRRGAAAAMVSSFNKPLL